MLPPLVAEPPAVAAAPTVITTDSVVVDAPVALAVSVAAGTVAVDKPADLNGWTHDHLAWMRLWGVQISLRAHNYLRESRQWWYIYIALTAVVLVLTGVAGIMQVPAVGCPLSTTTSTLVLQWVGIGCAALAVIIGGVASVLQPNTAAQGCRTAADALNKLAASIDLQLRAAPAERKNHLEYSKKVSDAYAQIVQAAPTLLHRHSIDDILINKTLVTRFADATHEMEEIQKHHIDPPVATASAASLSISAPAILQNPGPLPLVPSSSLPPPSPRTLPTPTPRSAAVTFEDKRLAEALAYQMHRLEEHIDDGKITIKNIDYT
jgi:hypothetical protein